MANSRKIVKRKLDAPLQPEYPKTWYAYPFWGDFVDGDLIDVTGLQGTWTFKYAHISKETEEVVAVTVYGGTGGPKGVLQFRTFTPDRLRPLSKAKAKTRVNTKTAKERAKEKQAAAA